MQKGDHNMVVFLYVQPSGGCQVSNESKECRRDDPMQLTTEEKRDFLERIRTLVIQDVIQKEDRDDIFRVCMTACDRELAKLKSEE